MTGVRLRRRAWRRRSVRWVRRALLRTL